MNVRRTREIAAVAVILAMTAACSPDLPQPDPAPAPAVAPAALTVPQTENVLTSLGEVLAEGDAALDPALLQPRVEVPALTMRSAEYVRAEATENAKPPTVLPTTGLATVVPQTTVWPRTQLVVTEQPEDLQAPRILVLRQDTPRDNYRLWGWARLLQGTPMPATAPATTGSPVVAPDDDSLLVPPSAVLSQFSDVLAKGTSSEFAASFAEDPFQAEIAELARLARTGTGDAGDATMTFTPADAPVTSLGTVDGGAIVVGDITALSTMTITTEGASLPIQDPFLVALSGASSASSSFVRTYTTVVVFYVPPKDSGAQVQVLAAELVTTAASAS